MKKTAKKQVRLAKNLHEKKAEFFVGVITIVFLLIFVGKISASYLNIKNFSQNNDPKTLVTPIMSCSNKNKLIPTPTEKITTYLVKDGDSFWKISETVCGNGKYAENIKNQNNYTWQSLLLGDVIKVNCK